MKIWFKQKLNWIVMAIAAVVALSFIWTLIPGFSKLPTNVDNMRVAVVDRDNQQISKQMKKGLKDNLPFKEVTAAKTNAGIKRQIKNRDVSMVVIIPKGFSSAVQAGRPVQMKYYRGTANGMIEAMAQKTAVNQINSK
ncbi:MAG: YhgE/Pip domain-containing protein, partial [Limosilactobacillus sp.]